MHGRGTYTYAEGDRHAYPPSHPAEACKPHLYPTTYPATTAACGRLGRVHLACLSRASRVPISQVRGRLEGRPTARQGYSHLRCSGRGCG